MNTQNQKERNARKRAKLKAKRNGETLFSHLYVDVELIGCNCDIQYYLAGEVLSRNRTVFQTCKECFGSHLRDWPISEVCSNRPAVFSRNLLLINGASSSSASLEDVIEQLHSHLKGFGENCFFSYTIAITSQGQRSVKEWHGTAETGVAHVGAAISTLVQSLSRRTL